MKRLILFAIVLVTGCARPEVKTPATAASENHGKELIVQYGCQTCHVIPGIQGGGGMLGPSLEHYGSRRMIGTKVPMTPENLARYIEDPPKVDPDTRMPPLGVTSAEAHDVAAYLLTLQ